jgi:hypothetical protein
MQLNGRLLNNELDSLWKEAVVVNFKVVPLNFREGAEKDEESQDCRSVSWNMNSGLPEYEAGVAVTEPWGSQSR